MSNNFLNTLAYISATSIFVALFITIIVFGFTMFVLVFSYVFIPLLVFAGIRWLWPKKTTQKTVTVEFIDKK